MEHHRSASPVDETRSGSDAVQSSRRPWTPDQLVRLENDWRRLQRHYAYHPVVRIIPLSGNPPCEFQVEYHARTLFIRDDGQLDYLSTPGVHIWLPPSFPHEPPLVRPIQAIFHPNVTMEGVLLAPPWQPTQTLSSLVKQIGELLVYQTYDPYTIWNPAAVEWLAANAAYLPTDAAADFAPEAPDDPLERICRNGPATLQQIREQLTDLCTSMLQPVDPPSAGEVNSFAEQIRLGVGLFMDDDVPDSLRETARILDEWAQALPLTTTYFEGLRQRHIACNAALQAAGKVAEARRALLKELTALDQLCQAAPRNVAEALAALPEPTQLEAAQANLKVVTAEAQKRLAAAKLRLSLLRPTDPRGLQTLSDLLETRMEAEIQRASKAIAEAMDKTKSAIETITPTVDRAVEELIALEQIIGWREFADLNTKSRVLVDQIVDWGSAGIQAYFVSNEGGEYGPYEFEQKLEFGEWVLVCRNVGRMAIEVWDLAAGKRLGASETGQITIALKTQDGTRFNTTFRLTARCDELWIQVDYLTRQIGDLLVKQAKAIPTTRAQTWAAGFGRMLSNVPILNAIVEATRKDVLKRTSLVNDLKALAPYKERLTTSFLLERHTEVVTVLVQETKEAQKQLTEANERIAYIFARSQRDLENHQPMVPPKYAREYEENKNKRDNALEVIERARRLMEIAVNQVTPRLASATLFGFPFVPGLAVLPMLPEELSARAPHMSDEAITVQVQTLEEMLKVPLWPATAAPEAPAVVSKAPEQPSEIELTDEPLGEPAESHVAETGETPPPDEGSTTEQTGFVVQDDAPEPERH